MFQISTGKFFEKEKQRKHDEKFVFYSNVQTFRNISIDSPKILVEQVESGALSCFVVSYQLITEKHPIIIKCGEQDFIQQFLLVWSFFSTVLQKTIKKSYKKYVGKRKVHHMINKQQQRFHQRPLL